MKHSKRVVDKASRTGKGSYSSNFGGGSGWGDCLGYSRTSGGGFGAGGWTAPGCVGGGGFGDALDNGADGTGYRSGGGNGKGKGYDGEGGTAQ